MSTRNQPEGAPGEVEAPLAELELPKRLRASLSQCKERHGVETGDITYLWVHVTGREEHDGGCGRSQQPQLSVEEWLNVVDEAASLGVNWLVISVGTALADFPCVWDVCDWAQSTHGMTVGIHCNDTRLTEEDLAEILKLDTSMTRLLVPKDEVGNLRHLEEKGIQLREADPRPGEQQAPCEKPTRMIFVNPSGHLYTCGLVEGMEEYHLGSIFNGTLDAILHNSALPHAISEQVPREGHGCDGCPPLMAQFFQSSESGRAS